MTRILSALAALTLASTAGAQTLYQDNFAATEDQQQPTGWLWVGSTDSDFWYVDNGRLQTGDGNTFIPGACYGIINEPKATAWSDYTVSMRFSPIDADQTGKIILLGRVQDTNNYYMARLTSTPAAGGDFNRSVDITLLRQGAERELATVTHGPGVDIPRFELLNNGDVQFDFELIGQDLRVFINGRLVLSAKDSTFSSGSAGLGQAFHSLSIKSIEVLAGAQGARAAASAQSGQVSYRLLLLDGLRREDAERQRTGDLKDYSDVFLQDSPDGTTSIFVGKYATEAEARAAARELEQNEGLVIMGVREVREGGGAAAPDKPREYRAVVGEFANETNAQGVKTRLDLGGIYPSEIKALPGGRFQVQAGPLWATQAEAQEYVSSLLEPKNFKGATVVRLSQADIQSQAPTVTASDIDLTQGAFASASPEERQRIQDLLRRQDQAASGQQTVDEVRKTQEELDKLDERYRQELARIRAEQEADRQKRDQMALLLARFDAELRRGNLEDGGRLIDEMSKLDAANPMISVSRDRLEELKKQRPDSAPAATVDTVAQSARDAERSGDLQTALSLWNRVRTMVSSGPVYDEAIGAIANLQQRINQQSAPPPSVASDNTMTIVLAAVAVVFALVIGGLIMMVMKTRKRDRELLALATRPQAGAGVPGALGGLSGMPPGMGAVPGSSSGMAMMNYGGQNAASVPPSSGLMQAAPVQQTPSGRPAVIPMTPPTFDPAAPPRPGSRAAVPLPDSAGIRLDAVPQTAPAPAGYPVQVPSSPPGLVAVGAAATPAPTAAAAPAGGRRTEVERIAPGAFSPAPAGGIPVSPPSFGGGALDPPSSGGFPPTPGGIGPVTPQAISSVAISGNTPINGGVVRPGSNSSEFMIPTTPVQGHFPVGATPIPVSPGLPAGMFFTQGFDDEEVGKPPKGWSGQYPHSTLVIAPGGVGGGNCLRFEKKTGTASAYHSCKFPDAGGRIAIEFDIRCDDKNKYLLGFYIEKDEDFRQAISTIVHRTNLQSPPTLRLQGESSPYTLGQWVHVRYLLDLPRNLVDGWVDEQPIAAGVRLSQAPKVINTLSIRDNSATTGILMLDNLRIYRAI